MQLGANIQQADFQGNTPLHHAVAQNALKAAKLLLDLGANVEARNARGETPFDIARRFQRLSLLESL